MDQERGFSSPSLPWLLEEAEPGPRYLAWRDLLDGDERDAGFQAARREAHGRGPIAAILAARHPEGYWSAPGAGYLPKYTSTVWAIIALAQLGASAGQDPRIAASCAYLLENALAPGGQFTASTAPSGTADCLQGNLCWALLELGYPDTRLDLAFEWMARSLTGEGVAPAGDRAAKRRYYAGKCGPDFACGSNNRLPCAWGGVKVMLAFSRLPVERRTPLIERAIQRGSDFLLGVDPATAAYPNGWADKPSGNWWKFGFPVFYVTDLLQNVEALVGLGYGQDPRLANALAVVSKKGDQDQRWLLEYDYAGKTWTNFGPKKQPSKWVTIRALRVLKAAGTVS